MILGGVFDAHPEFQVVVGRMGKPLRFMLQWVEAMTPVPYAPLSPPKSNGRGGKGGVRDGK
jgi:hypothetical protein